MDTQKTPEELLSKSKTILSTLEGLASKTLFVWIAYFYVSQVVMADKGATESTVNSCMYGLALVTAAFMVAQKVEDAVQSFMAPKSTEVMLTAIQKSKSAAKSFTEGKPVGTPEETPLILKKT